MRLETLLLIVGVLVFAEPFFGIPSSWKTLLSFFLGFMIILIALLFRYRTRTALNTKHETPIFIENSARARENTLREE